MGSRRSQHLLAASAFSGGPGGHPSHTCGLLSQMPSALTHLLSQMPTVLTHLSAPPGTYQWSGNHNQHRSCTIHALCIPWKGRDQRCHQVPALCNDSNCKAWQCLRFVGEGEGLCCGHVRVRCPRSSKWDAQLNRGFRAQKRGLSWIFKSGSH